ncbi:MAG: hypothetical protein IIC78_14995 [Chloroflexi bacterium]|nr:hypothetical protein [Chloroflexota bacterium]
MARQIQIAICGKGNRSAVSDPIGCVGEDDGRPPVGREPQDVPRLVDHVEVAVSVVGQVVEPPRTRDPVGKVQRDGHFPLRVELEDPALRPR